MPDEEPVQLADQKPSTTAAPKKMDKLEQTILKTAIEAIPLLTIDNYSLWKNRVENMLDLQELYDDLTGEKGSLTKSQDVQLRTILTSKLDSSIHANVIDHNNEKDARAIWKSISNYFASSEASNRARVFKELLRLKFSASDIPGFITSVRTILARFHEVGINIPVDISTYLILDKLPSSLDNVCERITHSDKEINPELALEQLRVYYNDQQAIGGGSGTKNDPIALLTDNSRKCKKGAHNPLSGHSESNCWTLYPERRPAHLPKINGSRTESTVSSFHSSPVQPSFQFILDSGSSAHMVSNPDLFCVLDRKKLGDVRTSSGDESLKIEGIGTIRLVNELGEMLLNQVLYVPDLVVNLLSVRCLILEDYQVLFLKNFLKSLRMTNLQ